MSAASPPDYRDVTGQPPIASGAPQAPVAVAGPGGIAMVPYPTVGGPIYVSAKFDRCLYSCLYSSYSLLPALFRTLLVQVQQSVPMYTQPRVIHTIPPEFMPNDYLPVTLVVVIICSILNITSMGMSLPALLCSILV